MDQCRALKADGARCTLPANGLHGLCWAHDPKNAEQRRQRASKAARAKPNAEVRGIKEEIKAVIGGVKGGELDRNDAAVMIQGYRALKDFIALERQVKETDELEGRLQALEQATGGREKGGRRWGA